MIASPIRKWPIFNSTISRQRGDGFRRLIVQPVTGMDFQAGPPGHLGAGTDAIPLRRKARNVTVGERVAPGAGVNFDHGRAQTCRGLDLPGIGVDKQRNANAGVAEPRHRGGKHIVLAGGIEAALGGHFGAPLGNQTRRVRLGANRNRHHLVRGRHLEVERLVDLGLEPRHVVVADVAPILAQMGRDAVGARRDCDLCRQDGVGMTPAARVAHGRDVVDVDAEANGRDRHA